MMTGTITTKLSVTALILSSMGVMAKRCEGEPTLVIEDSYTTCAKSWIIQREYNHNADVALCATKCDGHHDCTHFSVSDVGTCVTYRGCSSVRTAKQHWDTYVMPECDSTAVAVGEDSQGSAPASPFVEVQAAINLVNELAAVQGQLVGQLADVLDDLANGLLNAAPAGGAGGSAPVQQLPTPTTTPPPTSPPVDLGVLTNQDGSTGSASTDPRTCADMETSCVVLASFGYCDYFDEKMRDNMRNNCPVSCETCPGERRRNEDNLDFDATLAAKQQTLEEAVTQMAVQAGFRYQDCIEEAPLSGPRSTLVGFAPAIMGDLMDFSNERRRWGFNKNNFIVNIARPIEEKGVTCADIHEVCVERGMELFENGLDSRKADVQGQYAPFVTNSNLEHFVQCANDEISAICSDFKDPLCTES